MYFVRKKSSIEMHRYAVAMFIHRSNENGCMNENRPGGSFLALAYRMLMPSVMKGAEKSTAVRRS